MISYLFCCVTMNTLYFASGLKKAELSRARLTHKGLASHPMRVAAPGEVCLTWSQLFVSSKVI